MLCILTLPLWEICHKWTTLSWWLKGGGGATKRSNWQRFETPKLKMTKSNALSTRIIRNCQGVNPPRMHCPDRHHYQVMMQCWGRTAEVSWNNWALLKLIKLTNMWVDLRDLFNGIIHHQFWRGPFFSSQNNTFSSTNPNTRGPKLQVLFHGGFMTVGKF